MVNFEEFPQQLNQEALFKAGEKYRDLKIREHNKELKDPKELDELLSIDFRVQLYDNPPINSVFSPEAELAKVKKMPREQKREALAAFKENLARQREAWAVCRVFIERCIEFDNDTPRKKLDVWVQKFGEHYGFTEQQKKTAERLLDGYYVNRQRALWLSKRYPDNSELVSELSGIQFDNDRDFDISIGPMSVDIETDGFNAGRIYQHSKEVTVKLSYMGFASLSEKHRVHFIVLNRNAFKWGKADREETTVHEHEHEKSRFFRAIFDRKIDILKARARHIYAAYRSEQDPELKRERSEEFFRIYRQDAFQSAKDEVIAMKKDRSDYSYDFFFKQDGSPYDYLAYIRDFSKKKNDPLLHDIAQKILVDEYRIMFEKSLAAFDDLEKGGYTRDETIAMLADKLFEQWPKTAKRLLEQRGKQSHV